MAGDTEDAATVAALDSSTYHEIVESGHRILGPLSAASRRSCCRSWD